jgi:hypothetical protein
MRSTVYLETKCFPCIICKDQQLETDIKKVSAERQPWTEAWEKAWEAYQGQKKPGGDAKLASFRNRAKDENDARYLVHQVSDWCSGAAANFGWMREAKRENTRCGL